MSPTARCGELGSIVQHGGEKGFVIFVVIDLIDYSEFERPIESEGGTLRHHLNRPGFPNKADQPLSAAGPREHPQRYLG